jgi:hypothetical protein
MDVARDLRAEVERALPRLRALDEAASMRDRGPRKWVRKEILGHLIDSAANNHRRFVRARLQGRLAFPGYEQDAWVALHGDRGRPWRELVDLFEGLNRHAAHVIESTPRERLAAPCVIGDDEPKTLGWLMEDYVRHMRHHLAQILG